MRASRPVAATLAAFSLAAFTAACSSNAAGSGGGSDTLRVAANSTDREPMDAVVAAFRKANPDIEVSVTYADTDQLQSTLRTQLSSGTAPDVFTVWPGNGNPGALQVLQKGGYLADLSGYSFASQIADGDKSVTQVDGKTYIVPVPFNGIGAIYNKATLKEIGGTEPQTWDDVLALCTRAKDHGKVLLALGNQTNWVTQLVDYSLAATTVYAKDPSSTRTSAPARPRSRAPSGSRPCRSTSTSTRRAASARTPTAPATRRPSPTSPRARPSAWSR